MHELGLEDIIGETQEDGSITDRVRYIDLRSSVVISWHVLCEPPHDSSGWVKEYKQIALELKNERLQKSQLWEKDSGKLVGLVVHMLGINQTSFWDEFWTRKLPYT